MEGGPARWQKVSDAVAGFLRADGKLAPIYATCVYKVLVFLIISVRLHRTRIALRICIGAIFCILYKECVKSALVAKIGDSVVYFKLSLSGTFPI